MFTSGFRGKLYIVVLIVMMLICTSLVVNAEEVKSFSGSIEERGSEIEFAPSQGGMYIFRLDVKLPQNPDQDSFVKPNTGNMVMLGLLDETMRILASNSKGTPSMSYNCKSGETYTIQIMPLKTEYSGNPFTVTVEYMGSTKNNNGLYGGLFLVLLIVLFIIYGNIMHRRKMKNKGIPVVRPEQSANKKPSVHNKSYCKQCGAELEDDSAFCGECGNRNMNGVD